MLGKSRAGKNHVNSLMSDLQRIIFVTIALYTFA